MEEDRSLFERIRKDKDRNAYALLFKRWYPPLMAYATNYVSEKAAEDVVQDVFIYLWEKSSTIDLSSSVSSYLFRSVKNKCLNSINSEAIKERVLSSIRFNSVEVACETDIHSLIAMEAKLRNALCSLPDVQRKAFEMNRFEKKTYEEIARIQNVTQKTIEYRISQALKKLRIEFKDYLK